MFCPRCGKQPIRSTSSAKLRRSSRPAGSAQAAASFAAAPQPLQRRPLSRRISGCAGAATGHGARNVPAYPGDRSRLLRSRARHAAACGGGSAAKHTGADSKDSVVGSVGRVSLSQTFSETFKHHDPRAEEE